METEEIGFLSLTSTLKWRHNEQGGVSNHRRPVCLLNRRSKKISKLPVSGPCEENPPVTGGFPSQRASNAEDVSIWWRHHEPPVSGAPFASYSIGQRATHSATINSSQNLLITRGTLSCVFHRRADKDLKIYHCTSAFFLIIPRATKLGGVYWIHPVCLSVRLSVCLLTFRVHPVASTVQDGFFPYLVQMINSMRGCVACDDPWPWPISSRSFGLDLENRVRSVTSTVLDGFFLYLAQMITIIRGCVACCVFFSESGNLNFWQFFKKNLASTLKQNLQFSMDSFHI